MHINGQVSRVILRQSRPKLFTLTIDGVLFDISGRTVDTSLSVVHSCKYTIRVAPICLNKKIHPTQIIRQVTFTRTKIPDK